VSIEGDKEYLETLCEMMIKYPDDVFEMLTPSFECVMPYRIGGDNGYRYTDKEDEHYPIGLNVWCDLHDVSLVTYGDTVSINLSIGNRNTTPNQFLHLLTMQANGKITLIECESTCDENDWCDTISVEWDKDKLDVLTIITQNDLAPQCDCCDERDDSVEYRYDCGEYLCDYCNEEREDEEDDDDECE
jgi:hypothetical protein